MDFTETGSFGPPVVSLVARPNHGKTTLIEKLVPELVRRGYQVGTIKHHVHGFEMDKPGKDTWRHKQAGARVVALSSPTGLGIIRDVDHDGDIVGLSAKYFADMDMVLTEGYKTGSMPKIEVFRQGVSAKPLALADGSRIAFVSDVDPDSDLPCFALDDVKGLADFLVETFITGSKRQQTSVMVNGKVIYLNRFVEDFIRRSVLGMVASLKGCEDPQNIDIRIINNRSGDDDS